MSILSSSLEERKRAFGYMVYLWQNERIIVMALLLAGVLMGGFLGFIAGLITGLIL